MKRSCSSDDDSEEIIVVKKSTADKKPELKLDLTDSEDPISDVDEEDENKMYVRKVISII